MSCKHNQQDAARAVLVLGLIAAAFPVRAQEAQGAGTGAAAEAQTVVVTGTRSLNRRTLDSVSPIDVIGGKELQSTGSGELATVLARLLPSMNFPRPSGADASDAVRPAQLRGLSPDQTLVLVNGKRRHASAVVNVNGTLGRGSAPVDLNAIPLAAIDHIEVLRDGAAAQYGTDAIAGVVNIILKKGADGGDVEGTWGKYDKGDGLQKTVRGSTGFHLGDAGWVRVALEAADRDPTNRAGPDPRAAAGPRRYQVNQRLGDPESHPRTAFVNAQYRLSDSVDWYAFANYGERKTSAAATWRQANNTPIFPEGFLPLEDSKSSDASLVTGLRGELAGWRWDASVNHGRNRFQLNVDNTVNYSLGAASPTSFYAGKLISTQDVANLDVARDVPVSWLAGPLTVALGAEARYESYEIGAGEPNSYFGDGVRAAGSQGFAGFRPENAGKNSRNNQSLYANFEGDVTKNLSASLAARYENYSDFGSTRSAKASARYAVTPTFALRGTASNGFRAPSLAQQFYTITTTNFIVVNGENTAIETGTFPVNSAAARALGAQPLKPERARNLSIGAQWQPTRNWTTTVDLYRIDIDDRVIFSSNLQLNGTPLQGTLAAQGLNVGAARYFTNAVDTRTKGVDVVSTYRLNLNGGARADFTLAYNHNDNAVRHVAGSPALLAAQGLSLADRQTVNRLTVGSPKDKLGLSTDYTRGIWNGHVTVTRYGKFTVPQNDPSLDQTYDPQWVLDVSASMKLASNWRLTAGADNLTNRYPAQITSAGNLNVNGTNTYSGFAPNGFNGRFYYLKAAYAW